MPTNDSLITTLAPCCWTRQESQAEIDARPPARKPAVQAARRPSQPRVRLGGGILFLPVDVIRYLATDHLSASDRRHLCDSHTLFRRALFAIVSVEAVRRHVSMVVTLSGVGKILAEIGRMPPASQEPLLIALARRNALLPPPHRGPAARAVLAAAKRLSREQEARIISALATTLCFRNRGIEMPVDKAPWLRVEQPAWEAALRLPDEVRGIAEGALLQHRATSFLAPLRLTRWTRELATLPPTGRAALLTGLATMYFQLRDGADEHSRADACWETLLTETLALPEQLRPAPLHALVAMTRDAQEHWLVDRWTRMMVLATGRSASDRIAIYAGLAELVLELPLKLRVSCFDALWQCCDELRWERQVATLNTLASIALDSSLAGHGVDRIVDVCATRLPPQDGLAPLKTLLETQSVDERIAKRMRTTILAQTAQWPVTERARLLGYFPLAMELDQRIQPILAETRILPPSLRQWALTGLTDDWNRIKRAGGARWIDRVIMPLLVDMPLSDRVDVLLNLAVIAFGGRYAYRLRAKQIELSPFTWNLVERDILSLSSSESARLLQQFIELIDEPGTPAWEWALKRTNELPAGLRPLLLHKLATVTFMKANASPAPLHKLLPAIAALPAFYRAYPLQAVDEAKDRIDGFSEFAGYWKAVFKIAVAKRSLPREDRF